MQWNDLPVETQKMVLQQRGPSNELAWKMASTSLALKPGQQTVFKFLERLSKCLVVLQQATVFHKQLLCEMTIITKEQGEVTTVWGIAFDSRTDTFRLRQSFPEFHSAGGLSRQQLLSMCGNIASEAKEPPTITDVPTFHLQVNYVGPDYKLTSRDVQLLM